MSSGMIKRPGRQPSRSEQLLLVPLVEKFYEDEVVVIHHITEDTARCLQLEIERRFQVRGNTVCKFERIKV